MKIYNTLTRKKEEFQPLEEGKVKMYVCGPTVYNLIHIGNARPMICFDTVRRYLEYKGYDVNYVSNFTDVDDKIIKKANEEGVSAEEISQRYIAECKKDMEGMNIKPATTHPLATQEIGGMIDMIQTLIDKGYAYNVNGTVYYRTRKFEGYGKLSKKNIDDLEAGHRDIKVAGESEKEDPLDFVLWKPKKEGEPYWESPWSEGRPGWHIECSVMSKKYLADEIDIHAGGEDLIFPHHENEIAQSRAANGTQLANIWMHVGFLNMNDEKMSKSLGNIILAKDAVAKYGANALRLFFLSTKYEAPINFTELAIEQAQKSFDKYQDAVDKLSAKLFLSNYSGEEKLIDDLYNEFMDALTDDLNVANSLVAVEKIVKLSNTEIRKREPDLSLLSSYLFTLKRMFGILGLRIENRKYSEDDRKVYIDYIESRNNKDFEKSDILRKELISRHLM